MFLEPASGLRWRIFENELQALVYDTAKAETHLVDLSAVAVFSLFEGGQSPIAKGRLVGLLANDMEAKPWVECSNSISTLLDMLIDDLVKAGLLIERQP